MAPAAAASDNHEKNQAFSSSFSSSNILEVAVIGAGPAGLVATKQLVDICGYTLLEPQCIDDDNDDALLLSRAAAAFSSSSSSPSSSSSLRSSRRVSFAEGTRGSNGNIAVFEESFTVGGLWTRDPKRQRATIPCVCRDTEIMEDSSSSSSSISVPASSQPIYDDLITNLVKDMQSFSDRPFPSELQFFPTPNEMAAYYDDYAKWHAFDTAIHFNTRVEKCWKEYDKVYGDDLWNIQVEIKKKKRRTTTLKEEENNNNINNNKKTKETDDDDDNNVIVQKKVFQSKRILACTGHHRKAFVPDIRGFRHFRGDFRHSSAFQTPKEYQDKSVLIVGGGISGNDIAGVLSKYDGGRCKRITVSVRTFAKVHKIIFKNKRKRKQIDIRPGIERINKDGTVLFKDKSAEDGHDKFGGADTFHTTESFDAIIFATGYRYWYPYLPQPNSSRRSSNDDGNDNDSKNNSNNDDITTTTNNNNKHDYHYNYMTTNGYKMNRLYNRVLYIDDPSLAFIGVTNFNFSPAIMMEYQSKWYATVVIGEGREHDYNKEKLLLLEMEQEAATHDNDGTQDKLLFKCPSYCNSLVRQMTMLNKRKKHRQRRGYWEQVLVLRGWWHIKSLWVRGHPSVYWGLAILIPIALIILRWIVLFLIWFWLWLQ